MISVIKLLRARTIVSPGREWGCVGSKVASGHFFHGAQWVLRACTAKETEASTSQLLYNRCVCSIELNMGKGS